MSFLLSTYGHSGAQSSFPCLYCEVPKGELETTGNVLRTTAGIYAAAEEFKSEEAAASTAKKELKKRCKSIVRPPLTSISLERVIPSSLHIFMGILLRILDELEKEAKVIGQYEELEKVYKQLSADRRAFHQRFCGMLFSFSSNRSCSSGNHCRKLLTGDGPEKLTEFFIDFQKKLDFQETLEMLGTLQSFTKASLLTKREITKFERITGDFLKHVQVCFPSIKRICSLQLKHPQINITPKLHWLTAHVTPFMKKWGFWGIFSEQGIECFHRQANADGRQFASMREPDKRFKKLIYQSWIRNVLFDLGFDAD